MHSVGTHADRARAERAALVELALDVDPAAAAVLLDDLERMGHRVGDSALTRLVPRVWDLCSWPMGTLPRERWVALFRDAGYSHDFEPAERPAGALRLFRGSDAAGAEGMCWSTNLDVARWLALPYDEGWVYEAAVEPERLLAFVAPVYEDQFVVDTTGLEISVLEEPAQVAAIDVDALAERLDRLVEDLGVGS